MKRGKSPKPKHSKTPKVPTPRGSAISLINSFPEGKEFVLYGKNFNGQPLCCHL